MVWSIEGYLIDLIVFSAAIKIFLLARDSANSSLFVSLGGCVLAALLSIRSAQIEVVGQIVIQMRGHRIGNSS